MHTTIYSARVSPRSARSAYFLALGLLAVSSFAMADSYHYSVSDYPGATATLFLGESRSGTVAGFSFGFTNVPTISFSYNTYTRTYTPVASLPGSAETDVWNINDAGIMVGGAYSLDYSTETAFVRDTDGNFTLLHHPGWANTEAQGINRNGVVIGHAYTADGSLYTAFIYDRRNHSFTDVMPSAYTLAHGINSNGDVVGFATLVAGAAYAGSPAGVYGWYRTAAGAITLFRVNKQDTYARAINDFGVIGGFVEDSVTGIDTGFLANAPETRKGRQAGTAFRNLTSTLLVHIAGQASTPVEAVLDDGRLAGVALDASGGLHGYTAEWR